MTLQSGYLSKEFFFQTKSDFFITSVLLRRILCTAKGTNIKRTVGCVLTNVYSLVTASTVEMQDITLTPCHTECTPPPKAALIQTALDLLCPYRHTKRINICTVWCQFSFVPLVWGIHPHRYRHRSFVTSLLLGIVTEPQFVYPLSC